MGSGLAKQIRSEYPEAYDADCNTIPGDRNKLGSYTQVHTQDGFIIINAYTQYRFNRMGEKVDVFEYEAFNLILKKLAEEFPSSRIGFPMIGMGLACGDPVRIITAIENFSNILETTGGTVSLVDL
jgi:O-acetyl-ADP-ribose deacetylase (regulator of RNase III)